MLESDIKILEAASSQKIKEMELVHWYINVMEQGVDATKAMRDYAIMKKKSPVFFLLQKRHIRIYFQSPVLGWSIVGWKHMSYLERATE